MYQAYHIYFYRPTDRLLVVTDLVSYFALLCLFSFVFVFVQFEEFVFHAFILVVCVRVFGCTCGRAVHIVCRRDRRFIEK